MKKVCVVLGSKSDSKIGNKLKASLREKKIPFDFFIASAHRTPKKVEELAKKPYSVFIAVAGLSAALPGAIASHSKKPVIGVPVSAKLGGLDALLAIVQMPEGVPVACVGIDNAENAVLLAERILRV